MFGIVKITFKTFIQKSGGCHAYIRNHRKSGNVLKIWEKNISTKQQSVTWSMAGF